MYHLFRNHHTHEVDPETTCIQQRSWLSGGNMKQQHSNMEGRTRKFHVLVLLRGSWDKGDTEQTSDGETLVDPYLAVGNRL